MAALFLLASEIRLAAALLVDDIFQLLLSPQILLLEGLISSNIRKRNSPALAFVQ